MLIGIDLDEVLVGLMPQLIKYHNRYYKTSYIYNDFKSFFLWETWGGTKEETDKKIWNFYNSKLFEQALPIEGAIDAIEQLSTKYKLLVITSRPEKIRKKTKDWLRKYFPKKFNKVYFAYNFSYGVGNAKKKLDICQDLKIDLLIDDCLENVEEIGNIQHKMQALLFDRPWNRVSLPEKVTRVYSWQEIVGKVNKIP